MSHPEHSPEKQMARMNPEVKARWVAALRSGEYKQTEGALRRGDSFCCLGVLCNLHAQAYPRIAAKQSDPTKYMGEDGNPPTAVVRWARLPDEWGGEVEIDGRLSELTRHNDQGRSFAEIADAIESQL